MSDILNIRVTQRELDLILDLLHEAGTRTDADGQPAIELCHDLMEQSGDVVDEFEPTEIEEGRSFSVAENDFIDHGVRAREMAKNQRLKTFGEFEVDSSKAADRRNERMMKGTASPIANDPVDW